MKPTDFQFVANSYVCDSRQAWRRLCISAFFRASCVGVLLASLAIAVSPLGAITLVAAAATALWRYRDGRAISVFWRERCIADGRWADETHVTPLGPRWLWAAAVAAGVASCLVPLLGPLVVFGALARHRDAFGKTSRRTYAGAVTDARAVLH